MHIARIFTFQLYYWHINDINYKCEFVCGAVATAVAAGAAAKVQFFFVVCCCLSNSSNDIILSDQFDVANSFEVYIVVATNFFHQIEWKTKSTFNQPKDTEFYTVHILNGRYSNILRSIDMCI